MYPRSKSRATAAERARAAPELHGAVDVEAHDTRGAPSARLFVLGVEVFCLELFLAHRLEATLTLDDRPADETDCDREHCEHDTTDDPVHGESRSRACSARSAASEPARRRSLHDPAHFEQPEVRHRPTHRGA